MSWIDCKIRKPTAEDGDPVGRVFARTQTGGVDIMLWAVVQSYHVAWMPIPEFVPLPEPPDGYRIIDPATEPFDAAAKWYSENGSEWQPTLNAVSYGPGVVYAVPVAPPEPPKGYEILTDYDADPDPNARYWDKQYKNWYLIGDISIPYKKTTTYAVPIKPPEPPDEYEILTDFTTEWHPKTMHWVPRLAEWQYSECHHKREYNQGEYYAVPIAPPKPQYRPFANAEEFRPYRDRWWRVKSSPYLHPPAAYGKIDVALRTWQQAFDQLEFEDGTPFGVRLEDTK